MKCRYELVTHGQNMMGDQSCKVQRAEARRQDLEAPRRLHSNSRHIHLLTE